MFALGGSNFAKSAATSRAAGHQLIQFGPAAGLFVSASLPGAHLRESFQDALSPNINPGNKKFLAATPMMEMSIATDFSLARSR